MSDGSRCRRPVYQEGMIARRFASLRGPARACRFWTITALCDCRCDFGGDARLSSLPRVLYPRVDYDRQEGRLPILLRKGRHVVQDTRSPPAPTCSAHETHARVPRCDCTEGLVVYACVRQECGYARVTGWPCLYRAQVQLQTMFRNPWETQSLVWANLLDALRYLVVWNPLRARPARICRRALPSEPDRCRRAHLRREIAGVVPASEGCRCWLCSRWVRCASMHTACNAQHAACNLHIGALDGFFCAVAPHARSSSCSRSSRYTSSAIRPQPPQRLRLCAPGGIQRHPRGTVQYRNGSWAKSRA
jgi:hypothetical protein